MKNSILKALVIFGLISFSFKAGQTIMVTQPDKPTSTVIFYSSNIKEATERTKMYVKQGYIIKSFNIADDQNGGPEWAHAVVILEKY